MAKAVVRVQTEVGLHARPAAEFVKAVAASGHLVQISNRTGKKVLGNSILGILSLGVKHGEEGYERHQHIGEGHGRQALQVRFRPGEAERGLVTHGPAGQCPACGAPGRR